MVHKINLFTYDIDKRTLLMREIDCIDKMGYIQVYSKDLFRADIIAGKVIGFNNLLCGGSTLTNHIYLYTFIDDPNEALKIIESWIEKEYVSAKAKYG